MAREEGSGGGRAQLRKWRVRSGWRVLEPFLGGGGAPGGEVGIQAPRAHAWLVDPPRSFLLSPGSFCEEVDAEAGEQGTSWKGWGTVRQRLGSGSENGFAYSPLSVSLDRRDSSRQRPGTFEKNLFPCFPAGAAEAGRIQQEVVLQAPGPRLRAQWPPREGADSHGLLWFPPTLQRALLFPGRALGIDNPYPSHRRRRAQCLTRQPEARVAPGKVRQ